MADRSDEIKAATKAFILKEFLPGEDPDQLQETTPLLSGGILDSISTVKLVGFLEDTYAIEFQAHEISEDHLDSIERVTRLVPQKLGG